MKWLPATWLGRSLLGVGAASLLLRLWISVAFPLTGDEAYYYWWGIYPDWGYLDHPPMVGWVMAAMLRLADTVWSIRLPVVVLPLAVGATLWFGLRKVDRPRAAWAVLLFWLAPLNWVVPLMTTDAPLIFWSALSVAALLRAEQRERLDRATYGLYALSGFSLTGAFLSKYFAVVLGCAYLVYFLVYRRSRLLGFGWLLVCALPGPLLNLAYNISHGWPNIMFNVFNRNQSAAVGWRNPFYYLLSLVYLITPVLVWMGVRYYQALFRVARSKTPTHRLLCCLVGLPLVCFAVVSLTKAVGLHWLLSFYPFGFACVAFAFSRDQLKRCALGLAIYTGVHIVAIAALYITLPDAWRTTSWYPMLIRSYKTDQILQQVRRPDVVLMAESFTSAAIYGFAQRQYMPTFGVGSYHGRQDDLLVDFSQYHGKTIRIFVIDRPDLAKFQPYFKTVREFQFKQNGAQFYGVEGTDFQYPAYRKGILGDMFKRYHRVPAALPMTGCPFCERYCGQVRCPDE